METPVQSHNPNSFFLTRCWHDWMFAYGAAWSEPSVEIFYAMNLIFCINGEWNPIKSFLANDADKTVWMIWFAGSTQNSIENWRKAFTTLL